MVRRYANGLTVISFDPALRDEFRRLNVAWLERYFNVEPIDEQVLGDPEGEILAPGGEILFALLEVRLSAPLRSRSRTRTASS